MALGVALSTSTDRVAGSAAVHSIILVLSPSQQRYHARAVLGAVFTITTTIVTEIIGSVHSAALRSALIHDHHEKHGSSHNVKRRFGFNTNSRLFAASKEGGLANPNGWLMNALMALLLVISYAASALIVMELQILGGPDLAMAKYATGLTAPPIIVFGLSLFLQGVISLFGAYHCGDHWFNTDLLATTKQQIEKGTIVPRPHRCMYNVLQGQTTTSDPLAAPFPPAAPVALKPSARQPSAWSANLTVQKAVIVVWGLIPVYAIWGAIIYALSVYVSARVSKSGHINSVGIGSVKLPAFSWAFSPVANTQSFGVAYLTNHAKEKAILPSAAWPSILLVFMAIQSGLTLALHYSEAIINTTRDENVWRQAVGANGVSTLERGFPMSVIVGSLGSWRSVFLLFTKFFCHWLLSQSFQVTGVFSQVNQFAGTYFIGITILAHCAQIWYLTAVLIGFAIITTLIANYKPHGPQPAAYGHFQTLADLIDEWHDVVYWSHKSDESDVCHAGTRDQRERGSLTIQSIKMDRMYGGELDLKWPPKESV
ncbi:hypothetical protein FIBSPDRAFT_466563 [Athelia psychrophila]|uniref:Uncharacterized protein n=1 Tax=Athelia psychrophila TaxID=1759441 RepID=A0A166LKR8_9AGAM|nr:hypothetical protein FIBSPDRAFT_466563 [Fibularhizoctonia sp. CBS 109695]